MKDKGDGKGIIERFHVFIQTNNPIRSVDMYKFIGRNVARTEQWSIDRNCLEPSRYFYKHSHILNICEDAIPLNVLRFEEIKRLEDDGIKHKFSLLKPIINTAPSIERFKKSKYYRLMESGALKSDGKRYEHSCSILGAMKQVGLTRNEAMELFDQFSSYGQSFTRNSIERRMEDFGL